MNYNNYQYKNKHHYNNYKTQGKITAKANGVVNNTYDNDQHPEHPVRNFFFCVFCLVFSLSFSYLWVWELFEYEYAEHAIVAAVLIVVVAVLSGIISFKNSHSNYFAHRRNRKNRYYR